MVRITGPTPATGAGLDEHPSPSCGRRLGRGYVGGDFGGGTRSQSTGQPETSLVQQEHGGADEAVVTGNSRPIDRQGNGKHSLASSGEWGHAGTQPAKAFR